MIIMRRLFVAALVVGAALPALASTIPSSSGLRAAAPYLGHPATAHPFAFGARAPRHPYMAPNARSNIHDDAYQSDAYVGPGPLGRTPTVTSAFFVHECGSVTFDSRGRIVTVCVGLDRPVLHLLDPVTLADLASYDLPPRDPSTVATAFTSFGGGGYFYLDNRDRAVVPTTDGHIDVIAERGGTSAPAFELVRSYDVSSYTNGSSIISALPDWSGDLWFVTADGGVGVVAGSKVHFRALGEPIGNSVAVDETGAVWIVTDEALYRFVVRNGRPHVAWRVAYDGGSRVKPGQTEHGSGTTPTVIRRGGVHYVAITDNADPRMHVLIYREGVNRPICRQPVFPRNAGSTDNSLIAIGNSVVVENNYGYTGPSQRPPTDPFRTTPTSTPGLTRIAVDYRDGGCRVVWNDTDIRVPSVVTKASAATGLVYTYEHPAADEIHYAGSAPPAALASDPWYFTAVDLRTGRRVFSVLTGYGLGYNNNYAPVTLGPDGTAYIGTLGGLVRITD